MSGGSLGYFYYQLEDHVGDFGDKELDELVKDLAELFHDREWFLSGDTCDSDWVEARDNFKSKWFTEHGRQDRIVKYLTEIADEVYAMFGMNNKFCHNCKHWTQDGETSHYGKCEFERHCMTHRSESCDKYEREGDTV